MTQYNDQREDLLASDPHAFGKVRNGGAANGVRAHVVHPAGEHSQGVPVERRVQPFLDADGGMLDTLIAMVERGPLWDGNVPSKRGRDELIQWGLAARVVVNGEDGYTAATYEGSRAFCARYGADTLGEAMKARKRGRA